MWLFASFSSVGHKKPSDNRRCKKAKSANQIRFWLATASWTRESMTDSCFSHLVQLEIIKKKCRHESGLFSPNHIRFWIALRIGLVILLPTTATYSVQPFFSLHFLVCWNIEHGEFLLSSIRGFFSICYIRSGKRVRM